MAKNVVLPSKCICKTLLYVKIGFFLKSHVPFSSCLPLQKATKASLPRVILSFVSFGRKNCSALIIFSKHSWQDQVEAILVLEINQILKIDSHRPKLHYFAKKNKCGSIMFNQRERGVNYTVPS